MKKKKTILIVEDDDNIRDLVVIALTPKGHTLLQAKNGAEGVELALANHPDLILLDLMMPVMDGMTAFKKIREDAWGKNVPVIIMTNLSATEDKLVADMVANKPLHYLIKSDWEIPDVIKKIEAALGL
ncbi:response regulator [Candidatus Parcubacteria bacterium]|nr:response regulator [Candidatus Parcubacteria bacterium]